MEKELIRSKEAKNVTLVGFAVNSVLTICKILAGIFGKSGAMLADGIHSLSDFLTDIVVLIGFRFTEQPEDECHNYGHDKYETLATTVISLFLAIVGFEILKSGVGNIIKVINGEVLPKPKSIALVAAIISIVFKELLFRYTIKVGKKIGSSAVVANGWHHRSDAFSSIGTLIGIGGAILLGSGWTVLDPIASIVVSVFIFKVAYDILMPAVHELMESSLSTEEQGKIEMVIAKQERVKSYHKLRTRRLGTRVVIEFHMLVDEELDVKTAHNVSIEIEEELRVLFGENSIITIHIEPYENE